MPAQPRPRPASVSEPLASPAPSPSRPADPRDPDPRVEDYLDRVCAPLVEVVSYDTRQELRAELRAHLESLAASYEEIGSDPDEAVALALRQAGRPGAVADQYVQLSAGPLLPGASFPAWAGVLVAFVCFSLLEPLSGLLAALSTGLGFGNDAVLWYRMVHGALLIGLAGIAVGLVPPRRPVWMSLFGALVPLTVILLFCLPMMNMLAAVGLLTFNTFNITVLADSRDLLLLAPIGCAGAALGGWLRNHLRPGQARWATS